MTSAARGNISSPEDAGGGGVHEGRAVLGDHHGIHDQGKLELLQGLGHGADDRGISESAGLGGVWRDVFGNSGNLLGDQYRIQALDAGDAPGVLDGDEREDRLAVNAKLVKRFQVGLDACAARWVGSGDGECDGLHNV